MFVRLGLQLISDMSMRIYSEASIAENLLLGEYFSGSFLVLGIKPKKPCRVIIENVSLLFLSEKRR